MNHISRHHTLSLSRIIGAACFVFALLIVFRGTLGVVYRSWQQEEYSHGYIIPPIVALLIARKAADFKLEPRSSWAGFVMVAISVGLLILFEISGVRGLLPQVFVLALAGLTVLLLGAKYFATLATPMALLLLAVPMPSFVYYHVSVAMRTLSTEVGVGFLRLFNITVFLEGNVIDLGSYQLQVADACNGVRYLFPLICLGFILAYIYRAPVWKRVAVLLSAVPITILMNGVRIAFIGLTVNKWGPQAATGALHDFEGWVFFMACSGLLIVEVLLFKRLGRGEELNFGALWPPPPISALPTLAVGPATFACGTFLLACTLVSVAAPGIVTDHVRPVPLRQSFDKFPAALGSWLGRFSEMDPESLEALGTKDYLLADYSTPNVSPVNLYVLYYAEQDSTSNSAVHTPSVCIPAGGWSILSNVPTKISLKRGTALVVNRVVISKGLKRALVYFWYNQAGQPISEPINSRLYLLKSAITNGVTNGAMIRVHTEIGPDESETAADERLIAFLEDGLQTVNNFISHTRVETHRSPFDT